MNKLQRGCHQVLSLLPRRSKNLESQAAIGEVLSVGSAMIYGFGFRDTKVVFMAQTLTALQNRCSLPLSARHFGRPGDVLWFCFNSRETLFRGPNPHDLLFYPILPL
jgi:hypothetical protein